MKVLLRSDVSDVGRKGDVVAVKDGFARNFLFPKGMAVRANKGALKQAEAMQRARIIRDERERAAAEELAAQVNGKAVTINVRAQDGKLFGSVGPQEIAVALSEVSGLEIDRKQIELVTHIKELGEVSVPVRFHTDVAVEITVTVTD